MESLEIERYVKLDGTIRRINFSWEYFGLS